MNVRVLGVILVIFFLAAALWHFFDMPPEEEMRMIIVDLIWKYGPIVVLIGAFFEGLLLVGFYFPGSMVIFVSVALAGSPENALRSVVAATLGLYLAYVTNYVLGRYGWYRLLVRFGLSDNIERAKLQLAGKRYRYMALTFVAPGFAAFTSTAAGVLRMPAREFLMAAALFLILWNTFWGTFVYLLGETALKMVGLKFIVITAVLYMLYELIMSWYRKRYVG